MTQNSTCKHQTHLTLTCWIWVFRAIQSFNDASPKNKEELKQSVTTAYDDYPQHKLNRMWLTLQSCFTKIILHHGDNDYSIEHILKEKLEWAEHLPDILDVVDEVDEMLHIDDTDDDTYQMNNESDNESN